MPLEFDNVPEFRELGAPRRPGRPRKDPNAPPPAAKKKAAKKKAAKKIPAPTADTELAAFERINAGLAGTTVAGEIRALSSGIAALQAEIRVLRELELHNVRELLHEILQIVGRTDCGEMVAEELRNLMQPVPVSDPVPVDVYAGGKFQGRYGQNVDKELEDPVPEEEMGRLGSPAPLPDGTVNMAPAPPPLPKEESATQVRFSLGEEKAAWELMLMRNLSQPTETLVPGTQRKSEWINGNLWACLELRVGPLGTRLACYLFEAEKSVQSEVAFSSYLNSPIYPHPKVCCIAGA